MIMRVRILSSVSAALLALGSSAASAAMLNFETGFSDNQQLTNATNTLANPFAAYGIQFLNSQGKAANDLYAESTAQGVAGSPSVTDPQGFVNDLLSGPSGPGVWDKENAGSLGNFFLRGPGVTQAYQQPGNPKFDVTGGTTIFSIKYLAGGPTGAISGEIWDIDGVNNTSEKWVVTARNSAGTVLATQTSPEFFNIGEAGNLDGKAWLFNFALGANQSSIAQLDFAFTGTKTEGIGVAFDNFETGVAAVPLPAAAWLLLGGLGGLGAVARKRRTGAPSAS